MLRFLLLCLKGCGIVCLLLLFILFCLIIIIIIIIIIIMPNVSLMGIDLRATAHQLCTAPWGQASLCNRLVYSDGHVVDGSLVYVCALI